MQTIDIHDFSLGDGSPAGFPQNDGGSRARASAWGRKGEPREEVPEKEFNYHRDRIISELDMAFRASSTIAAGLHLRLSSLHMERLRLLASR